MYSHVGRFQHRNTFHNPSAWQIPKNGANFAKRPKRKHRQVDHDPVRLVKCRTASWHGQKWWPSFLKIRYNNYPDRIPGKLQWILVIISTKKKVFLERCFLGGVRKNLKPGHVGTRNAGNFSPHSMSQFIISCENFIKIDSQNNVSRHSNGISWLIFENKNCRTSGRETSRQRLRK